MKDHTHRLKLWKELRDILKFTAPLDGLISSSSDKLTIDIMLLDDMLEQHIPEYDSMLGTYKGEEGYSISDVVKEVYGERAVEIIEILMS